MAKICYYSLLLMTLLVVSPALGFPQEKFTEAPEQGFPKQAMYAQDGETKTVRAECNCPYN